ncbi:MAG: NAD(P)-binding domain-containing protein [Pleurocapsa minor GSE-CHR-MK-17-07R]|jgi:predicted dinucleotide-binding enzyme|nr:NAD(P)-binding domain-containing protein [Pleurocapsa minor GSE-CHR-MK 17-07R]
MKIAIIGSGKMGKAIGTRWAAAGHSVFFGSREADKGRAIAAEVGHNAQGGTNAEGVAFADVLLVATPWSVTNALLGSFDSLAGKVLIDLTNNFGGADEDSASVQAIVEAARGAHVVKAFNTIFHHIVSGPPSEAQATVFFVGDDAGAKETTAALIRDAGLDPVDAGGLKDAAHLDNLAKFIVHLGYSRGLGNNVSYKLVRI